MPPMPVEDAIAPARVYHARPLLMFAGHPLAKRIEAVEARLCAAVAASVPGSWTQPIGGGTAIFARAGSPVNKVVGLGFEPLDERELAALEERGPVRVELTTLSDPSVSQLLTDRGYRLEGFENLLGQPLPAAAAAPAPGVEVTPSTDDTLWGAIAIDGFAAPDETSANAEEIPRAAIEQVFEDMRVAAGFQRYIAYLEGKPAGIASLRIDDRIAMLSGATTLPWARRRGVQGALLARRLADAAAASCELAIMTTSPGTRSQSNAHRQGFAVLYARCVLTSAG
jgi:hypothetical protein